MRRFVLSTVGLVTLLTSGCGRSGPEEAETISREAFVQAYYELRVAGLRSPQIELSIQDRDRVLEELGVTEEELIEFAEVWGADFGMMEGVWEEVDSLIRSERLRSGAEEELLDDPIGEERLPGGEGGS